MPLPRFTAERSARSKAARGAGDRDLAARIGALPKPTTSAWLVNLLARTGEDELRAVVELAGETADAQRDGDPVRLRSLAARRRELLPRIAAGTAKRAEEAGQRVGPSVIEEFEQTLQAALADPEAAAAVRSGRLVHALRADGLEPVDLDGAVAVGGAAVAATPRTEQASGGPAKGRDEVRTKRLQKAREQAASARADAEAARTESSAASERATRAAAEARARSAAVDELEDRLEELRRRLEDARSAASSARKAAADAEESAARAERVASRTAEAAADADAALESLGGD